MTRWLTNRRKYRRVLTVLRNKKLPIKHRITLMSHLNGDTTGAFGLDGADLLTKLQKRYFRLSRTRTSRRRIKKSMIPLVKSLKRLSRENRIAYLSHVSDKTRDQLSQVILEVLRKYNGATDDRAAELHEKLRPYKKQISDFTDQRKSGRVRRKRLEQIGGGPMSHILRAALPLLNDLFPSA